MRLLSKATATAVVFAVGGIACKSQNQAQADSAAGSVAMSDTTPHDSMAMRDTMNHDSTASPIQVADVKIGKKVDAEKKISDETDDFTPHDTVFATVHTTGTAKDATINARFNSEDGKVVSDKKQTISPTSDAYTEFRLARAGGLKVGKYTLHVTLNGQETQSKDFTVKKP